LAGAFLATAFLAGAFLAGAFLATAFLAGAFLATAFLAGAFFAGAFFAGAFFAAVATFPPWDKHNKQYQRDTTLVRCSRYYPTARALEHVRIDNVDT